MRNLFKHLVAAAVVGVLSANVFAATTIVYANNPAPGDLYQTTPEPHWNISWPIGSSGWYYNNVREGAAIGIRTDFPRDGNGSVYLKRGGPYHWAPAISFLAQANKADNYYPTGFLGRLSDLGVVSYEWYRDPSSTATPSASVGFSLHIDRDGQQPTYDSWVFYWDPFYHDWSYVAPEGSWLTHVINDNTPFYGPDGTLRTLGEWKLVYPEAQIMGFEFSPSTQYSDSDEYWIGAVDNISWTINGITTTTNFEVVPEPTTMALFGFGLLGAAGGLLRRKSA